MKKTLTWVFAFAVVLTTIAAAPPRGDVEGKNALACPLNIKFSYRPAGILPADFARADLIFVARRVRGRGNKHSQVRSGSGTWAQLGRSGTPATYRVRPGGSFERQFELRQGCNQRRRLRLYYYVQTSNGSRREYNNTSYLRPRGSRPHLVVDLGNLAESVR